MDLKQGESFGFLGFRSGLGPGLSIWRRSVEANGGTLGVRDVPGSGCIFTIESPRHASAKALSKPPDGTG